MGRRPVLVAVAIVALLVLPALAVAALAPAGEPGRVALEPGAAPGRARTPEWREIRLGLGTRLDRDLDHPCHRGEPPCLDAVVAEMAARLDELGCDHDAPFAFTYLQMTRGVADALARGELADPARLAHLDAVFAALYFDAFDAWHDGRRDEVPAAWQIAFEAAEEDRTRAAADLLLGMNAHISRDLSYVVAEAAADAELSETEADDFRRVNEIIAEVKSPMLEAAAERYDPTLMVLDVDGPAGTPDAVALITRWRQRSFDLGLALTMDPAAAGAEIERSSAAAAALVVTADRAAPGRLPTAARDRYCSAALGD